MCTASWWFSPDNQRYQLWFNRDEQRTRALAHPPVTHTNGATTWLCPHDPQSGGTWLSVNQHGLTVCLLNNYAAPHPAAALSRGALVLACAAAPDFAVIHALVHEHRWRALPGFHLLALQRGGHAQSWHWDTHELITNIAPSSPFTTSAFDSTRIIAERQSVYQKLPAHDPDQLATYHDQHNPARSAESVLMARPDATTVSQSRIEVGPTHAIFQYRSGLGPEMLNQPFQTTTLPLR